MKELNIVYCSDENYFIHMAASIKSLLSSNISLSLSISIFVSGLKERQIKKIKEICSYHSASLNIFQVGPDEIKNLKVNKRFSGAIYYRLLAEYFIFESKCLYLDVDTIVTGDLSEIASLEIDDYLLAAVSDPGFCEYANQVEFSTNGRYFNSGVILLNLERWRKEQISRKILNFIENNDWLRFPDQDAMNYIVRGRWLELDERFNLQSCMFGSASSPVVIHYTGVKPWHQNYNGRFRSEYWLNRKKIQKLSFIKESRSISRLINIIMYCRKGLSGYLKFACGFLSSGTRDLK